MKVIVISKSLAKQLKIKEYNIYFPDIDFNFWNKHANRNYINKNKKVILTCACNLNKTKNHIQLLNFINSIDKKVELNLIGGKLNTQIKYFYKLKQISLNLNKKKILKLIFRKKEKI